VEERPWLLERAGESFDWVELDLVAGSMTGRRERAGVLDAEQCPDTAGQGGRTVIRLRPRTVTSLYQLTRLR
jgi:hypothetical protein